MEIRHFQAALFLVMFFCYEYDTLTFDFIQSIVKISDSWGRSSVGRAGTANQRGIFDGKSKKTFGGFLF